jgi:N-acetylglucosaminyldiphosphoundecaprenol N-acetyl-beta-D-mannosaminyltransferase
MPVGADRTTAPVLGVPIDSGLWDDVLGRVVAWARTRESRYVAICNVHVTVTAAHDPAYRELIEGADMATPDGAPIAWMLRRRGFPNQPRISGPDLMERLLQQCPAGEVSVYFYGSTGEVLELLAGNFRASSPGLAIAGMESPPFRPLTPEEDDAAVARINGSGAGIVFVGLGCPKQEQWMAAHKGRVNAVMIGVGAAFDFHAGTVQRAPRWMRNAGLEWLHRLMSEPRRLWRRYLVTNTLFMWGAFLQLTGLGYRD